MFAWLAVIALGAGVGLAELVTRYRDEPSALRGSRVSGSISCSTPVRAHWRSRSSRFSGGPSVWRRDRRAPPRRCSLPALRRWHYSAAASSP